MMFEFFLLLGIILVLGLIPSLVPEEKLHKLVTNLYISERSNLDVIRDELDDKRDFVRQSRVNECYSLTNCTSTYSFVHPVGVLFSIYSSYTHGWVYKEYVDVDSLTLYARDGDIECRVWSGSWSKSVFLFEDTHRVEFEIVID